VTDKPKKLTPKQKKFAKEYQKDLNATQAAKRADYSAKTAKQQGSRLLTNVDVKKTIEKDIDKTLEKLGIDVEYILGSIKETMERCKQAKPVFTKMGEHAVTEDANGDMATAYQFDASAVLKGAELLGKYQNLKLWTDKVEHSGDKENPIAVTSVDLNDRIKQVKGEK
jgi:phage terminase small subunit